MTIVWVRTTLDIDDDVLQAVKELAEARGLTAGQALSALARQALTPDRPVRTRNGILVLPRRSPKALRPTIRRRHARPSVVPRNW